MLFPLPAAPSIATTRSVIAPPRRRRPTSAAARRTPGRTRPPTPHRRSRGRRRRRRRHGERHHDPMDRRRSGRSHPGARRLRSRDRPRLPRQSTQAPDPVGEHGESVALLHAELGRAGSVRDRPHGPPGQPGSGPRRSPGGPRRRRRAPAGSIPETPRASFPPALRERTLDLGDDLYTHPLEHLEEHQPARVQSDRERDLAAGERGCTE